MGDGSDLESGLIPAGIGRILTRQRLGLAALASQFLDGADRNPTGIGRNPARNRPRFGRTQSPTGPRPVIGRIVAGAGRKITRQRR